MVEAETGRLTRETYRCFAESRIPFLLPTQLSSEYLVRHEYVPPLIKAAMTSPIRLLMWSCRVFDTGTIALILRSVDATGMVSILCPLSGRGDMGAICRLRYEELRAVLHPRS